MCHPARARCAQRKRTAARSLRPVPSHDDVLAARVDAQFFRPSARFARRQSSLNRQDLERRGRSDIGPPRNATCSRPNMRMPPPSIHPDVDARKDSGSSERRYLRVTSEPRDFGDGQCSAYLVNCPRRGRIGLEVCVSCSEMGRIRFHRHGAGPIVVECLESALDTQAKLPQVRALHR